MVIAPISYEVHKSHDFVFAKVKGQLTFADVISYFNALTADGDYHEGMNCLYCLDECVDLDGSLNDVTRIAKVLNDPEIVSVRAKTALIVPAKRTKLTHVIEGMLLMVSGSRIEHRLYNEYQRHEAYSFVSAPMHVIEKIESDLK